MVVVNRERMSQISCCTNEEFAQYLRQDDVDMLHRERSCWDAQLQNNSSDFCLDTDLLLFLMIMNGMPIVEATESAAVAEAEEKPTVSTRQAQRHGKKIETLKEIQLFSSIYTKVKRNIRVKHEKKARPSTGASQVQEACRLELRSPILETTNRFSMEQAATVDYSTPVSGKTVVHYDIYPCPFVENLSIPRSTTNILRLITATD